jgi:hypothetical protein
MAGRGRSPKDPETRRNHHGPQRGEWTTATATGWQHGDPPPPPPKVLKITRDVWARWFGSWFAAHWTPEDLPGIYLVARLYDAVMRGELQRSAELRIQLDAYGMTPKGAQDRRWRPPPDQAERPGPKRTARRYSHLRPLPDVH